MFTLRRIQPQQWRMNDVDFTWSNPSIGCIRLVHVCKEDGTPAYEQPVWSENRGEINVVVDDQGRIPFVEAQRHAIIPPELYASTWKQAPNPLDYRTGVTQLELPRGFTNKVMWEVEEEVKFKPGKIEGQLHINANTALFCTSPFVLISRATMIPSDAPVDPNERINRVVWIEAPKIREVKTLCGFTHGAIWMFRNWALEQKDEFWKKVGAAL